MNVVEVKELSKSYLGVKILDEVSFQVKKGSFSALLGRNGSGKSTILNIIMGNEKMDSGECFLFHESIRNDPSHLKNKIAQVSEKIQLDYPMSVKDFISKYAQFYSNFDPHLFMKIANEVDLDISKHFGDYSRGQKMQIVLMSALAQQPELILIDEVTSVLDAYSRSYFVGLLKKFTNSGGTIILTTNIVSEIQHYCSDVIFLSKNKVMFQTPLNEIPAKFRKVRTFQNDSLRDNPDFIWSGTNSDKSESYIIPNNKTDLLNLEVIVEDKRLVTLEDLYIYYSQRDNNE